MAASKADPGISSPMFTNLLVVLEETPEVLPPYAAFAAAKALRRPLPRHGPRRERRRRVVRRLDGGASPNSPRRDGTRKARAREASRLSRRQGEAAGVEAESLLPDRGRIRTADRSAAFARGSSICRDRAARARTPAAPDDIAGHCSRKAAARRSSSPRSSAARRFRFDRRRLGRQRGVRRARWRRDADSGARRQSRGRLDHRRQHAEAVLQGGERITARLVRGGVNATFKRLPERRGCSQRAAFLHRRLGAEMLSPAATATRGCARRCLAASPARCCRARRCRCFFALRRLAPGQRRVCVARPPSAAGRG